MTKPNNDSEKRELWKAIGALEANVQQLIEEQRKLEQARKKSNGRLDRKVDRLLYAILVLGRAAVAALLIIDLVRG